MNGCLSREAIKQAFIAKCEEWGCQMLHIDTIIEIINSLSEPQEEG